MAPSSELARSAQPTNNTNSASLSLSTTSPSSAPLSVLPTSKAQPGKDATSPEGGGVDKDTPMADSPGHSNEQIGYYSVENKDESHEKYHPHGDSGEIMGQPETPLQQQRSRRPKIRSSRKYSSQEEMYNSTSPKHYPEVKYAKAGILPPPERVPVGGGANNGANFGEAVAHILPGETLYLSQQTSPINRPSGQYQMHPPGYTSNEGNGPNDDGNNGYLNGGGGYYGPNGASAPQAHPPHPFQKGPPGNGGYPPYPYMHYPQIPYYYDAHGNYVGVSSNTTSASGLNVRGEEVGIVLVVLLLWVGAIILFFNRWGKIRMLEPYQPKFCETHRPSCPMADVTAISGIPPYRERTFSKYNLSTEMLAANGSPHFVKCNYHGIPTSSDPAPGFSGMTSGMGLSIPGQGFMGGGSTGVLNNHRNSIIHQHHHHYQRPRQNSVFVTSPSSQVNFYGSDGALKSSSRKTKSAVDLPTLVLSGEFIDNVRRNSKNSVTQL